MPDTERTALYRLRDDAGGLLYVGIAANPLARWIQHASEKKWWEFVTRFEVEWFETRTLAKAAETVAIQVEVPEFNRAEVEGLKPRRPLLAAVKPKVWGQRKTPRIAVAIDEETWELLGEVTGDRGRSAVIRDLVAWFVDEPGAKLPKRPSMADIQEAMARLDAKRSA